MIDIHSHILPGIDDGIPSMPEAMGLAESEATGGTRYIFATPHIDTKRAIDQSVENSGRVAELNDQIQAAGIPIEVVQGAELHAGLEIIAALDAGLPLSLGPSRRYVLLDLPRSALPFDFNDLLFELQARGIIPILAHPERTVIFQQEPWKLFEILERGIACQVNAGSLRGNYGPSAQVTAMFILKRSWAHFLASDAHRQGKVPILRRCVESLRTELTEEYLKTITEASGRAVLEGRELPELLRIAPSRRSQGKRNWLTSVFSSSR